MTPTPASLSTAISPKLSEANASPNRRPREIGIRGAPLPSWVRTTMGNPGVLPLLTLAATIRSVTLIRVAVLSAPRFLPLPALVWFTVAVRAQPLQRFAQSLNGSLCSSVSFSSRSLCSKRWHSLSFCSSRGSLMLLGILQLPLPLLQTLALAFLLFLASAISMLLRLLGRCDFFTDGQAAV